MNVVIEVYSGWAGECKNIHNFYRKIRKEYDDTATLSFLACKSDGIDSLEEYRGKSQPYFMIYRVSSINLFNRLYHYLSRILSSLLIGIELLPSTFQ